MRIDPVGPTRIPPEPNPTTPGARGATTPPAADQLELKGGEQGPDERAVRLEALREAVAQGRYRVTEDALARAILRAVRLRHDKSL